MCHINAIKSKEKWVINLEKTFLLVNRLRNKRAKEFTINISRRLEGRNLNQNTTEIPINLFAFKNGDAGNGDDGDDDDDYDESVQRNQSEVSRPGNYFSRTIPVTSAMVKWLFG